MSASQPALFNVQEFTDAGITLVGGRLYTYATGTTAQKIAYTDPEGTVPQTYTADGLGGQYIALNARGELATSLYLAAGVYDLTLRRADGSIVWTRQADATVSSTALALPTGADLIGLRAPGAGAVLTTVGAYLGRLIGVDPRLHGASPTASDAANTTALNKVFLIAVSTGRPVYLAEIYTHLRLADVVVPAGKVLAIFGETKNTSGLRVSSAAWPYGTSSAAMLKVTGPGNFSAKDISIDQQWFIASHPNVEGYNDSINPNRWGGNFYIDVNTTGIVDLDTVHFPNCTRGVLVSNAAEFNCENVTSAGLESYSQTVLAADAVRIWRMHGALTALRWTDGETYMGNGNSGIFPWNCGEVNIDVYHAIGHQMVGRGPEPWQPNTAYQVGTEFRAERRQAYRVTSAYTSGSGIEPGVVDAQNSTEIFYGMKMFRFGTMIIDTPIADTALYDWVDIEGDNLYIKNSGDMGLATSGSQNVHITHITVDGVRCGGIDLSYGSTCSIGSALIIDVARGSSGLWSRIDQFGRFASGAGFALSGLVIGAQAGTGQRECILGTIKCQMRTLPPASDAHGPIRAAVNGIFAQPSSNVNHFNSVTSVGCRVADYEADMPSFFHNVALLRFWAGTVTGAPIGGEVFTNGAGTVKFVLCAIAGAGSLCHIRKLTGTNTVPDATVFTGTQSGATITSAAIAETIYLKGTEAGNYDKTSKFLS